ncbi:hypothetical protein ScPMuIL_001250 [Solemya velum]
MNKYWFAMLSMVCVIALSMDYISAGPLEELEEIEEEEEMDLIDRLERWFRSLGVDDDDRHDERPFDEDDNKRQDDNSKQTRYYMAIFKEDSLKAL